MIGTKSLLLHPRSLHFVDSSRVEIRFTHDEVTLSVILLWLTSFGTGHFSLNGKDNWSNRFMLQMH